jgi:hypothetical protein
MTDELLKNEAYGLYTDVDCLDIEALIIVYTFD